MDLLTRARKCLAMHSLVAGVLIAVAGSSGAATLGDFAGALAVPATAGYSAKNWNALEPVKSVKWRDATLKDAPSSFAREGDFVLDGHGRATALVVGARQMMFDIEILLSRPLERKGLARTLKAQFSPATLIEQLGGDCRTAAAPGGWRVYRLTLPGKRALFMQIEFAAGANPGAKRLALAIDNKPSWAC